MHPNSHCVLQPKRKLANLNSYRRPSEVEEQPCLFPERQHSPTAPTPDASWTTHLSPGTSVTRSTRAQPSHGAWKSVATESAVAVLHSSPAGARSAVRVAVAVLTGSNSTQAQTTHTRSLVLDVNDARRLGAGEWRASCQPRAGQDEAVGP